MRKSAAATSRFVLPAPHELRDPLLGLGQLAARRRTAADPRQIVVASISQPVRRLRGRTAANRGS